MVCGIRSNSASLNSKINNTLRAIRRNGNQQFDRKLHADTTAYPSVRWLTNSLFGSMMGCVQQSLRWDRSAWEYGNVCQYRPQCQYVSSQTFSQKCRITATSPSKRLAVSPVSLQPSSPKYELKHYTFTRRIFLSPPYCNMTGGGDERPKVENNNNTGC